MSTFTKKHQKKEQSIQSRFFLGMTMTAASFMIVLLIGTSFLFYRHFISLESEAALKQLDYISSQLDFYMTSTTNYAKTLSVDGNVQQSMAAYNKNPNTFTGTDQLQLKNRINHIIQSTPFIHSVTLYSPDKETVATTDAFPYYSSLETVNLSEQEVWVSRKKHPRTNQYIDISVLSLLRPFYSLSTGGLMGYIEIAISEQNISAIYKNKASDTSHIFILDEEATIQSSDGSHLIGATYEHLPSEMTLNKDSYYQADNSIIFVQSFPGLHWYIINSVDLMTFIRPVLTLFCIAVGLTLACILACLYVSSLVSKTITSPIATLIRHTKTIKDGKWSTIDKIPRNTELGHLFTAFNIMIEAQEELKNDLVESEQLKNKISLDLLQQQVNPHFLYNTLDNICSLAELDEKENLIDIVMNLSTFYREGLSNGKFYISIKEELDITEAYLHIMGVRYFNKLTYSIDCPTNLYGHPCLKLLLQPIVENSIYHGIKELEYKGRLEILVYEDKDSIRFIIQDNGVGISNETIRNIWENDSDHFGLKNIHQRIQLYYGDAYGLVISNRPEGGCRTLITIGKEALDTHANTSCTDCR